MTIQTVFVLELRRPYRAIMQTAGEILVCKKMTWAPLPSGRRCLLGSSAFYTRAAAERCKLGLLRKMASTGALQWLAPYGLAKAHEQLQEYKKTGVIH